ncbi:uncharacterized protein LOC121376322 [Gigantopelta aegis]|uniref:uncharacterized protein LOC121376322 n=1 Tax=Gigantopelta aegis TaxID=1735272 RepID=UPI001B88E04B|nr:uncharacterized protein LOC121376322 [Gigantopelta aegis]
MKGVSSLCGLFILTLVIQSCTSHVIQRRGALSYIVHKGCLYLSHYVKDNYPVLEPTHDTSVAGVTNWVDWARDVADASYLPTELLQGLVKCGRGYTFFAFNAPQRLIHEHGLDPTQLIPGK